MIKQYKTVIIQCHSSTMKMKNLCGRHFGCGQTLLHFQSSLRWFRAENHFDELVKDAQTFLASQSQIYDVIDFFGAACRMRDVFTQFGYRGIAYDVKIHAEHDLCSQSGFRAALAMTCRYFTSGGIHCSLQNATIYRYHIPA